MPEFDPRELAEWSGGAWRNGTAAANGFYHDSREVTPGAMFVALRTGHRDGHDFIDDARAKGASCALVARYVKESPLPQLVTGDPLKALQRFASAHRKRFSGPVIGVTGSCGKTSTKDILAELLAFRGPVLKTEGNFNNHIGVPLTLLRLEPEHHAIAVIEAGINMPGEMDLLSAMIEPTHGVVTNVAPVHLEHLRSLEGVAGEKAVLLKSVPPNGVVAFPEACGAFKPFQSLASTLLVLESGDSDGGARRELMRRLSAPVPKPVVSERVRRTRCRMRSEGGGTVLLVRFSGSDAETGFPVCSMSSGMAENAGIAIALAKELGARVDDIREVMSRWKPGPYRGQLFSTDEGVYYLDCYNSNPLALVDSLEAFAGSASEEIPRLYVIGSMAELGVDAEKFHFEALRLLRLRDGDFAFLIGAHAGAMARGLAGAGGHPSQWSLTDSVDPVRERLKSFRGAVFLKGSRRYRLERLWEELRANAGGRKGVAC